jgi:hypothetical protein
LAEDEVKSGREEVHIGEREHFITTLRKTTKMLQKDIAAILTSSWVVSNIGRRHMDHELAIPNERVIAFNNFWGKTRQKIPRHLANYDKFNYQEFHQQKGGQFKYFELAFKA